MNNQSKDNRWHDADGVGLIETMIAMFILAVGISALASVLIAGLSSLGASRDRQDATQIASSMLEEGRSQDFENVALDSAEPGVTGLGTFEGEPIVHNPTGAVPHQVTTDGFAVTTYVTEGPGDTRRVTTIVAWTDKGAPKSVRYSTLVAEATRGLPAPEFVITPPTPTPVSVLEDQVVCVQHTLANLGQSDSYDWKITQFRDDGVASLPAIVASTQFVDHDRNPATPVEPRVGYGVFASGSTWFVWAEIGSDHDGDPLTPLVYETMEDQTSDGRHDTQSPIPTRENRALRTCYFADDADLNHEYQFGHTFRSLFDSLVSVEITDTVVISNTAIPGGGGTQTFWLHTDNNGTCGNNCSFDMDGTEPTATTLGNYGQSPRTPGPGLALDPAVTNRAAVKWTSAIAVPVAPAPSVTLSGTSQVTFWSSTNEALTSPTPTPRTLHLRVELFKNSTISANRLGFTDIVYNHASAGWDSRSTSVDFSGISTAGRTFGTSDSLILRITCQPASPVPCHLAFDTTTYLAKLVVGAT